MKLLAGIALFLLCALAGESKARRLRLREQRLRSLSDLIRAVSDRQLTSLLSFGEALLGCSPSPEREQLLDLLHGKSLQMPLLTAEERDSLTAYAQSEKRSLAALREERDALLSLLGRERERAKEELAQKAQIYRSVGYLSGAAALLLVL